MSVALLFASIVIVVFGLAFLSGRRYGALALSLAAGSVLSNIWSDELSILLQNYNIGLPFLPSGALAVGSLLLLPLAVMFLNGPKYTGKLGRVFSALAIGVLTAAFLVQPLGKHMALEADALNVYQVLASFWQYIVTVGLLLGLFDLLSVHGSKTLGPKKH